MINNDDVIKWGPVHSSRIRRYLSPRKWAVSGRKTPLARRLICLLDLIRADPMKTTRLTFDVFGRRIIVESTPRGWAAFHAGDDGKRRPTDIVIPRDLDGPGIARYLDDLFHEYASPEHPAVRIL